MSSSVDLLGQKFGRLKVIDHAPNKNGRTAWMCKCDCGESAIVTGNDLRMGKVSSCGCLRKENASERSKLAGQARGLQLTRHGGAGSRLYNVWKGMKARCFNPKNKFYMDYGGRGITICTEWLNFECFRNWAFSNGYDKNADYGKCTIDRIDNDKGYFPQNCRFVDLNVQANNRRNKRNV